MRRVRELVKAALTEHQRATKVFRKPVDRPSVAMIARFDDEAERSFRESFERLLPDGVLEEHPVSREELELMEIDAETADLEDLAVLYLEPPRNATSSS